MVPGAAMASPLHERLHREGRSAHPDLELGLDAFARGAGCVVHSDLVSRVADDLYLAIACDVDVPGAWDRLVTRFRPRLEAIARGQGLGGQDVDDVVAKVLADLALPGRDGARTRIGGYDGTGRLETWLGIQVVRVTIRMRSGQRARLRDLSEGMAADEDPARDCALAETLERFREALAAVWPGLTVRERLALTWKFGHGVRQVEIARLFGVGPPRVSRIVESGIRRLRAGLRQRLPDFEHEHAIGPRLGEELRYWLATSVVAPSPVDSEVPDATD